MELKPCDERRDTDRQRPKRSVSPTEQAVVYPPFASEGLEQIRDSHC